MIYVKSNTNLSTKLTHANDVQICDVTIPLFLYSAGGMQISYGGGIVVDYKWNTLTTHVYSDVIHDVTQDVYNYHPVFQVYLYKEATYPRYNYCMILPYSSNLSNIDGTTFKFKLAIQAI